MTSRNQKRTVINRLQTTQNLRLAGVVIELGVTVYSNLHPSCFFNILDHFGVQQCGGIPQI
jgi:hypothetical protein